MVDIWKDIDLKKVDEITCYFNDLTSNYFGVFYVDGKAVGDYTANNSQEVENIAKDFGLQFDWGI